MDTKGLIHPLLPRTALAGAVLLLLGGLLDVVRETWLAWSQPSASVNQLLLRPAISLAMAILLPWAIVRMNGIFYWGVVSIYGIMFLTMVLSVPLWFNGDISPLFAEMDPLDVMVVTTAALAGILLCSRQAVLAFYRHGRAAF
jgi:hypothetical protein